jgi:hypothetical protein
MEGVIYSVDCSAGFPGGAISAESDFIFGNVHSAKGEFYARRVRGGGTRLFLGLFGPWSKKDMLCMRPVMAQ